MYGDDILYLNSKINQKYLQTKMWIAYDGAYYHLMCFKKGVPYKRMIDDVGEVINELTYFLENGEFSG
jgi:hypothetical protein